MPSDTQPAKSRSRRRIIRNKVTEDDVRNLAYALWEARGAPSDGDPTQDWVEAERRLLG